MAFDDHQTRVSSCALERGLYVLRYVSSDQMTPPVAEVRVAMGSVAILSAPGRRGDRMTEPGSGLILVADTPSTVEIVLSSRSGVVEAKFSLDLVDRGVDGAAVEPVRPQDGSVSAFSAVPKARPQIGDSLSIDAHVSRIGDLTVRSGEWIAGPQRPLPIEGFSIALDSGELGVETQVQTARRPGVWSQWHRPGAFAGSRQRAESLTGIRLRLVGQMADRHTMEAEVLFLGSPAMAKSGQEVEFSSFDPMLGLKLSVKGLPEESSTGVGGYDSGRVRVFRAQQRA